MPLLARPPCPNCGCRQTRIAKSPAALARLIAGTIAGFVFADVVPLEWKCPHCGQSFLATGDKPHKGIGPRGFPVDDVPK